MGWVLNFILIIVRECIYIYTGHYYLMKDYYYSHNAFDRVWEILNHYGIQHEVMSVIQQLQYMTDSHANGGTMTKTINNISCERLDQQNRIQEPNWHIYSGHWHHVLISPMTSASLSTGWGIIKTITERIFWILTSIEHFEIQTNGDLIMN